MNKYMKRTALILVVTILFTGLPLDVFASEDVEPVSVNVPNLGEIKIVAGEVQIDSESKLTEMVYNEDEYLEKATNEDGCEFFFTYDEEGVLKSIVDNKDKFTGLKYDDSGELVDAEHKTYAAIANDDGETEIYTEGQDGEFVIAAVPVAVAAIKAAAATAAVAYGAYKAHKIVNYAKSKSREKGARKDKKKGSENRQQSGKRERNIGHKNGEEHSRVPKGNGSRPRR